MSCEEAALKFLQDPGKFYNKTIKFPDENKTYFDNLSSILITKALFECEKTRPKVLNKNFNQSAAYFIGLFLKANNPNGSLSYNEINQKKFKQFICKIK